MKFFAVVLEIFVFKGEFRYGTLTVTNVLNEKVTTLHCCGLKQLLYHKLFINSVATRIKNQARPAILALGLVFLAFEIFSV